MKKNKVSRFEFAIGEVIEGDEFKRTHTQMTEEEELDLRKKKLKNQSKKIKINQLNRS